MTTSKIYGYCRVSTKTQNIERQETNILKYCSTAILYKEKYTGTTSDRRQWQRLLNRVKSGDTIIFDSVSRMSRNKKEGVAEYFRLYEAGVHLVFLKEPHINTSTYQKAIEQAHITETDNKVLQPILEGVTTALKILAAQQIELAFEQSEKEVMDLRQRTKEGVGEAIKAGKKVGRPGGKTYETEKSKNAKAIILKYAKEFVGKERGLTNEEVMKLAEVNRNTYYKYMRELKAEMEQMDDEE